MLHLWHFTFAVILGLKTEKVVHSEEQQKFRISCKKKSSEKFKKCVSEDCGVARPLFLGECRAMIYRQ